MALATTLLKGALSSARKGPPYDDATLPTEGLVAESVCPEPARVAAYAEVCGFPHTDRLPAAYPHLLGFPLAMRLMAARDFPFPLLGLVHTGVDVVQHRALTTADRPAVHVHAEGLAPHRRGSEFRVVTSVRLDGAEVWSSRSTYLCRHRRPDVDQARPSPRGTGPESLPRRAEWALPGDLGRRYGAVSGDRNPIHLHPLSARAFGFPRAIAHGMWSLARCLAHLAGEADALTAEARFSAPVLLPATVVLSERDGVFELRGAGDTPRLHVSGTVSSGRPSSAPPDRPSRSS
jgi:acyl dehydratase